MRKLARSLCVWLGTGALVLGALTLTDGSAALAGPDGAPWTNGKGKKLGHIETVSNNKFCPAVDGCWFWAADPFRCFYYCTAPDGTPYSLTLQKRESRGPTRVFHRDAQ
jgi:hypothetical protein